MASHGGNAGHRHGPSSSSGRQHNYRGIRLRNRKWVSEIRVPRTNTRIWLGTFLTPEMAAAAYDVAALAIKGPDTTLNFPYLILSYPIPASTSPDDIRAAASLAAENMEGGSSLQSATSQEARQEYVDDDELLNMPNILADMAEGMLLSPPRLHPSSPDGDEPHNSPHGGGLWSYYP